MANILLATPTSDYTVTSDFARSIFDLVKQLTAKKINVDFRTIRSADIEVARNRFATRFLKDKYTHLLFIDEDMGFAAQDILACLDFAKPIVGISCVRKGIDLKALVEFFQKNKLEPTPENLAIAMSCVSIFNLELYRDAVKKKEAEFQVQVERGFVRVRRVGTGLMLIQKEAFLRMIEAKCVEVLKNQQLDAEAIYKDGMYGFFSKVRVGDILLSEDFSFCHRWVNECAGEIWCKIDSYARHLGEFKFSGRYLDKLTHNMY